jgi:hypothetical protein
MNDHIWCSNAKTNKDQALAHKDTTDGRVSLVIEDHILDDERQQALDCPGTNSLGSSGTQMRIQRGAISSPNSTSNGDESRSENHWSSSDADCQRHEKEVHDAHHDDRERS